MFLLTILRSDCGDVKIYTLHGPKTLVRGGVKTAIRHDGVDLAQNIQSDRRTLDRVSLIATLNTPEGFRLSKFKLYSDGLSLAMHFH